MKRLNEAFRERIGLSKEEELTLDNLNQLLEKTAWSIPFENFRILNGTSLPITKENVERKILQQEEGGLCYELNPILYYFLLENGFNASLVRGEVYNPEKQDWSNTGRTHAAVLIHDERGDYLVDTGFGGNLPLRPVPMSGELIQSRNGEYQVSKMKTDFGDYVLNIKVRDKDEELRIGYAFHAKPVEDVEKEMNEIQHLIETHENSKFNKRPLAVKLLKEGSQTLTDSSFTTWSNREQTKEEVQTEDRRRLAKREFGLHEYPV